MRVEEQSRARGHELRIELPRRVVGVAFSLTLNDGSRTGIVSQEQRRSVRRKGGTGCAVVLVEELIEEPHAFSPGGRGEDHLPFGEDAWSYGLVKLGIVDHKIFISEERGLIEHGSD
jgi:hypothetical protein